MFKLQNKAQATNELVKKKMNESKEQFDSKVNAMEEQRKYAGDLRRVKIEKRIQEMKVDHQRRTDKLKQASKLIGEALSPKEETAETANTNVF